MDYSGLINLILATVIYSTLIAPNIQKLDKIREEIINVEFPINGEDDYAEKVTKAGVRLNKGMTRYADKYNEIKEFLRYFYVIVAAVFLVQLTIFLNSKERNIAQISSLAIALVVLLVLTITLRRYLVVPWKVRSIPWLASKGIAPVYLAEIFSPKLTINNRTANGIDDEEFTKISIVSGMQLGGFRYVLTVENLEGDRLYYVSSGLIAKHIVAGELVSRNAQGSTYELQLAKAKLKDNKYRARLLVFDAAFGGKYNPKETTVEFSVGEGSTNNKPKELNQKFDLKNVEVILSNNKIKSYAVHEGREGDRSICAVLTSRNFQKLLSRASRPFILENSNGNLSRADINMYCSRRYRALDRFKRIFKIGKRTTYRKLVPKHQRAN